MTSIRKPISFLLIIIFSLLLSNAMARAGGGGGGGHSSGGGSHGGGFGGGYHSYGSGHSGPASSSQIIGMVIVILIFIVFSFIKNRMPWLANNYNDDSNSNYVFTPDSELPEGLSGKKIQGAFLGIQEGWQKKDLGKVRKWISDGVYQRFHAQFDIMNKLGQVNYLSNIKVKGIRLERQNIDGMYHTADVAISFSMNDSFICERYPQFNQQFAGDTATEYWTFIKRTDAKQGKNLYQDDHCPNCGDLLELQMGEISRCKSCGTLTNNASYDWVLSEITQSDDYNGWNKLSNEHELKMLTQNDTLFCKQRIEDIASNVFMQVMEYMSGGPEKLLTRFSDDRVKDLLVLARKEGGILALNRLYLNSVDLVRFSTGQDLLNLGFELVATYQRVDTGNGLELIDDDVISHNYRMVLSKKLDSVQTPEKETVFSHECANCGAPYTDTTNDVCTYCGAALIDLEKNWVLTWFEKTS